MKIHYNYKIYIKTKDNQRQSKSIIRIDDKISHNKFRRM